MPSVDVAMARSLRGGVWESIAQSLHSSLARRDIGDLQDKATDAATAFSSWDNCMEVNYCKWPVIAVIIIGGLIILSIVWCIIRCACCGLSCCCSCFQCLKCCGNCCGCCDPPKGSRHKYLDNETIPPNYGYRPEPPMKAPDFGPSRPMPTHHAHDPPQYAEFETSRKGGDDSLPSMPTWEQASSRKVEMEVEAVEMNQLNKPQETNQSVASASAAAAASAAAVAAAAGGHGPQRQGSRDPYRQPSPMGGMGYAAQDPYAGNHHGYEDYGNGSYGPAASHFGGNQYGAAAGMPTSPQRASPPRQEYGYRGYDAGPPARSYTRTPQPADPYVRAPQAAEVYAQMPQSPNRYAQTPQPMNDYTQMPEIPDRYAQTPQPAGPYAADPRGPSPSAMAYAVGRTGNSPAPPADFRERMGSNASPAPMAGYRTERMGSNASPAPQADYGHGNQQYDTSTGYGQRQAEPHSPLQNSAGFDFNSGYSRSPVQDQFGGQTSPVNQPAPNNGGFTAYNPLAQ